MRTFELYQKPFHITATLLLMAAIVMNSPGAFAQTRMSIRDCISYAGQNNSNLRMARQDEDVARQVNNQTRGRGLPQANITGTWSDNLKLQQLVLTPAALALFGGAGKKDTSSSAGSGSSATPTKGGVTLGYRYSSVVTGEVTQMIFDPSFWVGLKAAKYNRMYYAQTTQQVNEQVAYNIANAYYQVIVAQKQLELLGYNINSTGRLLANTKLQFQNGVAKQVDVNRIQVNYSNLISQQQQAQLNLDKAMNNLKYQMGMDIAEAVQLSDTSLSFTNDATLLQEVDSSYFERRINYKLAKTNITLQDLDRRNNISGYYPTLTAFANYAYNAQGPNLGLYKTNPESPWINYTTSAIGLRFRFNVFDGLQRNALVQQSKIKTRKMEENLIQTRRNINLEVSNALTQYRNTLQRINADSQNVSLAQEVYKVTQLEFREGVGTSTDVVNSETSLRQAQNTYVNTLLNLYLARLDLERAKGNILNYLNSNQ